MPVLQFITHQFSKTAVKTEMKLRDSVMPSSDQVDQFCQELKQAFHRRAGRDYGCFMDEDEAAVLPQKLKALTSGKVDFVATTVQWMQALQSALDAIEDFQLSGHVVFIQEEHLGDEVFYVFVVSYKESLMINSKLEVEQSRFVDLGSSLMGARVELSLWQANASQSYLTLATPRSSNPWLDAFRVLCGFCTTVDKKQETDAFLQIVSNFSMDVPEESVQQFQSQIVDYCMEQEKLGEAVEKSSLMSVVSDIDGIDSKSFNQVFNKDKDSNQDKVHIDRGSLRKFMRYTGREKDLTISFASSQLDSRIQYDTKSDVLTIKGLPKALREQLQLAPELD